MSSTFSIVSIARKLKAASQQSTLRRHKFYWWLGVMMVFLLASCATATPPIAETPTPPAALPTNLNSSIQGADEFAVTALILAERQAAIDQDLSLLSQLWAEDAHIMDGRNSLGTADDYIWAGRAAILDRYRVAVFPFVLPPLTALDDTAVITNTGNGATVQNGTDTWQLYRAEGRWWLSELRYQMTASK